MPYGDFTIKRVQKEFQLHISEEVGTFAPVPEVEISDHLAVTLADNVPLAVAVNTEKARSELIIAPILVEVRKRFDHKISFFSGIEFSVDRDRNLYGYCDFILSKSSEQLFLQAPIVTIVEAKNENIMSGLGQCLAEMVAARTFNEQEGTGITMIYGAVTSGSIWKFLKMMDAAVTIDLDDYSVKYPQKIVGILSAMAEQQA